MLYHVPYNIERHGDEREEEGEISKRGGRRLRRVIVIIVTGPAARVTTSAGACPMVEPSRTEYSLAMIMPYDPLPLHFVFRCSTGFALVQAQTLSPSLFIYLSISLFLSPAHLAPSVRPHRWRCYFAATRMQARVCVPYPFPSNKTMHRDTPPPL